MNPLINPNRADVQFVLCILLVLYAWYRGSGPERSCTLTMLGMFVLDRIYHAIFGMSDTFATVHVWHFALDFVAFATFVGIALFANRAYPMWLAALQLVSVLAHLVRGFVEPVSPIAYYVMGVVPSYMQIVVLALGLWAHRRRFTRFGEYRDWRLATVGG